jgi:hypothetical protein
MDTYTYCGHIYCSKCHELLGFNHMMASLALLDKRNATTIESGPGYEIVKYTYPILGREPYRWEGEDIVSSPVHKCKDKRITDHRLGFVTGKDT